MPTIRYEDSMKAMVARNPDMAIEILEDALNAILSGELDDGRLLLRQYVNATIGFPELAQRTGKDPKNLMRSLGKSGSPTATNLFQIVQACMDAQGLTAAAHVVRHGEHTATP